MLAKVVVPVRLPPGLLVIIDKEVKAGKREDRSDAVRTALSEHYGYKEAGDDP
jgi:Arc/MetJ-type ribon-helix-helix transcriptional regulator